MAYEFDPLEGGDVIEAGDLEIEALHPPGHTTKMVTCRVDDEALHQVEAGAVQRLEARLQIVELALEIVAHPETSPMGRSQ